MAERDTADGECSADNVVISSLFRIQQANPDLLSDPRLVAIQCLKAQGFVPADYSADDFDRDKTADTFPFDKYEEATNNCLWQAGYAYFKVG
jgi:hypothetical protein